MNLRPFLTAALAAFLILPAVASAQPAETSAAAAPGADAAAGELTALVDKVKAKIEAGATTEAALAAELQAFDALREKYAAEKTDTVAMIGVMQARLYLEVFDESEKGLALLKQVKADFPATQVATNIDRFVAAIEAKAVADAATAVGKPFATFSEKDLDGRPLDLAAYKGKVVLVDFWATWCGPCVQELPNVVAAYQKYHSQGFEVIGISLDKDRDALTAFIKSHQMTWPQYFDGRGWENKLAQAYGIQSIPATFLLDGEGRIVAKGLRGEALAAKVGELLGAK
jgi:peroxiredoxin